MVLVTEKAGNINMDQLIISFHRGFSKDWMSKADLLSLGKEKYIYVCVCVGQG